MPDAATIGDVTRWIAELGGYTGKSSGGPPGATVLRRGIERLHIAVEAAVAVLGLDEDASCKGTSSRTWRAPGFVTRLLHGWAMNR